MNETSTSVCIISCINTRHAGIFHINSKYLKNMNHKRLILKLHNEFKKCRNGNALYQEGKDIVDVCLVKFILYCNQVAMNKSWGGVHPRGQGQPKKKEFKKCEYHGMIKITKHHHLKVERKMELLELIHFDICEFESILTRGGKR